MSLYGQPGPFPFEPLEHAVRRVVGEDATDRAVARVLQCSATSLPRYRMGLNADQADRFAIRLGLHPAAVWGDLWWRRSHQDVCSCGDPLPLYRSAPTQCPQCSGTAQKRGARMAAAS